MYIQFAVYHFPSATRPLAVIPSAHPASRRSCLCSFGIALKKGRLYNSSAKPHLVTVPATTHHSVESPIFPIPLLRSFPVSYPQLLHLSCHPKLVNGPERDRGEHHCAAHKECYVVLVQVDVGEEIFGDLGAGAGVDDGHGVCCFCLFVCLLEGGGLSPRKVVRRVCCGASSPLKKGGRAAVIVVFPPRTSSCLPNSVSPCAAIAHDRPYDRQGSLIPFAFVSSGLVWLAIVICRCRTTKAKSNQSAGA
jgi:hypothetical protein